MIKRTHRIRVGGNTSLFQAFLIVYGAIYFGYDLYHFLAWLMG